MAINTRGFGVDVMPQYTPVNPSLVAFNPTAITDGLRSGVDLKMMLERLAAQKALAEENALTKDKRIGATNTVNEVAMARGQKDLRQMPSLEEIESLEMANKRAILPVQGKYDLAKLGIDLRNVDVMGDFQRETALTGIDEAKGNRRIMPEVLDARSAVAKATTADAGITQRTAMLREEGVKASTALQTTLAKLANSNAPLENTVKVQRLYQELQNAKTDKDLEVALKEAQIGLMESQTFENYQQRGKIETPDQEIKRLMEENKLMEELKVSDGKRAFGVYRGETYEDGNLNTPKKTGSLWWKGEAERDPVGEAYNTRYKRNVQRLNELQGAIGQTLGDGNNGSIRPKAQNSDSTIVSTKAQFDSLPSGARFTGKDGKVYTKP